LFSFSRSFKLQFKCHPIILRLVSFRNVIAQHTISLFMCAVLLSAQAADSMQFSSTQQHLQQGLFVVTPVSAKCCCTQLPPCLSNSIILVFATMKCTNTINTSANRSSQ